MEKTIERSALREIFLILALGLPFLGVQWITGTLVNAMLLSAVFSLGLKKAFPLAFIPSIAAFFSGIMPVLFFLPFIWCSNLLLMAVFWRYKNMPIAGILIAAIAKGAYFFLLGKVVSLCGSLIWMMQFATALIGGLVFLKTIDFFRLKRF